MFLVEIEGTFNVHRVNYVLFVVTAFGEDPTEEEDADAQEVSNLGRRRRDREWLDLFCIFFCVCIIVNCKMRARRVGSGRVPSFLKMCMRNSSSSSSSSLHH
jgi:hypothetical protein